MAYQQLSWVEDLELTEPRHDPPLTGIQSHLNQWVMVGVVRLSAPRGHIERGLAGCQSALGAALGAAVEQHYSAAGKFDVAGPAIVPAWIAAAASWHPIFGHAM